MLVPNTSLNTGGPHHHAGLILRVVRPDGQVDEFYLAGGLTIGRSMANTIVLADDESVDRTHARVEVAEDGEARVLCVESESVMTVSGVAVREVSLKEGVCFRVGRAEFDCLSGQREIEGSSSWMSIICPFCGSRGVPEGGECARPCPSCNHPLLPVLLDPQETVPVLVPVDYGGFRAERYVARGGMGLVLKGVREGGAGHVAIKILLPGMGIDRREAERFEQEIRMLALVRHPNVVRLLEHGEAGRFHFLALEWVDGPSLRKVIDDANHASKLTEFAVAFRWFEQVSKGLAAIHELGMVHRDIKPSNILIGPDGVALVADLGIAKRIDAAQTSYTTSGNTPGTYDYMAPEQIHAPGKVDGQADLYSLGVTFYELLTSRRPVGNWLPASVVNPSVPAAFDVILGSLMAPIPEARNGWSSNHPILFKGEPTSAAGLTCDDEGAGQGQQWDWRTKGLFIAKGALVGIAAGAIAATCVEGSAIIGAFVGCLPGALGAYLGMRSGSEIEGFHAETSPCGE